MNRINRISVSDAFVSQFLSNPIYLGRLSNRIIALCVNRIIALRVNPIIALCVNRIIALCINPIIPLHFNPIIALCFNPIKGALYHCESRLHLFFSYCS